MITQTYVDIHILQTVPPSNLNRDDAGSPKQAVYGGARRARVSSQAWKRATRRRFAEKPQATRTKRIATLLADRLAERAGLDAEQAARVATNVLSSLNIKAGKKATETAYLLFFGLAQLERLVDLVADRAADLAAMDDTTLKAAVADLPVRETLGSGHPIDVALFGRMVADIPGLNVDAATQVAHALSTHPVEIEFDYYTAVDDEKDREDGDDTGAGMIGTVEFNSATLYRFATVGVHQLRKNLDGDTDATIDALATFLDAFARSMPTGHGNTFAHRTLPSLVSVIVRDDQPVNLVSAFETPVRSTNGILAESQRQLVEELRKTREQWELTPLRIASMYSTNGNDSDTAAAHDILGEPMSFTALTSAVIDTVRQRLTP
jgi:CRISPR system Cascade subunit CasC